MRFFHEQAIAADLHQKWDLFPKNEEIAPVKLQALLQITTMGISAAGT